MKIRLVKTASSLVPADSESEKICDNMVIGSICECSIKKDKNYSLQRKYFSLLSTAWMLCDDSTKDTYHSLDLFRKSMEIAAGFCEIAHNPVTGGAAYMPLSLSDCGAEQMEELYKGVLSAILKYPLKNIPVTRFMQTLSVFMN